MYVLAKLKYKTPCILHSKSGFCIQNTLENPDFCNKLTLENHQFLLFFADHHVRALFWESLFSVIFCLFFHIFKSVLTLFIKFTELHPPPPPESIYLFLTLFGLH